jgi:transcriptional regulator with XRE-family HTH domain
MRKDAQTRIRLRIRARLDELGMTGRELARQVRRDATTDKEFDSWISGILNGTSGLHWKHFDAVADALNISPSELVRYDDATIRELTPAEMRLIRHVNEWPREIFDRWLAILDHFAATMPDKETAALLDRIRSTPRSVRRPVLSWLARLLEEGIPPEAVFGGLVLGADEAAAVQAPTPPYATPETPHATRRRRDGRKPPK